MAENEKIAIDNLFKRDPQGLRDYLLQDEWLSIAMTSLRARLRAGKKDALKLYFEAIELVSSKRDAAIAIILSDLGTTSVNEAKNMIEIAKRAMNANHDDAYVIAKKICRERIKSDPLERPRLMEELFGVRIVDEAASNEMADKIVRYN